MDLKEPTYKNMLHDDIKIWLEQDTKALRLKQYLATIDEKLLCYNSYRSYSQFHNSEEQITHLNNIKRKLFGKYTKEKLQKFNKIKKKYSKYKNDSFFNVITEYKYTPQDLEGLKFCIVNACYHAMHYKLEDDKYQINRKDKQSFLSNLQEHLQRLDKSINPAETAKKYIEKYQIYFKQLLQFAKQEYYHSQCNFYIPSTVFKLKETLKNGVDEYKKIACLFKDTEIERRLHIPHQRIIGNMRMEKSILYQDNHHYFPSVATMLIFELAFYFKCWTMPFIKGHTSQSSLFRPFEIKKYLDHLDHYEIDYFSMPEYGDTFSDIISTILNSLGFRVNGKHCERAYTSRDVMDKLKKMDKNISLTSWQRELFL